MLSHSTHELSDHATMSKQTVEQVQHGVEKTMEKELKAFDMVSPRTDPALVKFSFASADDASPAGDGGRASESDSDVEGQFTPAYASEHSNAEEEEEDEHQHQRQQDNLGEKAEKTEQTKANQEQHHRSAAHSRKSRSRHRCLSDMGASPHSHHSTASTHRDGMINSTSVPSLPLTTIHKEDEGEEDGDGRGVEVVAGGVVSATTSAELHQHGETGHAEMRDSHGHPTDSHPSSLAKRTSKSRSKSPGRLQRISNKLKHRHRTHSQKSNEEHSSSSSPPTSPVDPPRSLSLDVDGQPVGLFCVCRSRAFLCGCVCICMCVYV
jgi:hypothetical protein